MYRGGSQYNTVYFTVYFTVVTFSLHGLCFAHLLSIAVETWMSCGDFIFARGICAIFATCENSACYLRFYVCFAVVCMFIFIAYSFYPYVPILPQTRHIFQICTNACF